MNRNSQKTVIIYFVFGFLWILFSDKILGSFVKDQELYESIQTYKGWFYVIITSILLYVLIKINDEKVSKISLSLKNKIDSLNRLATELIEEKEFSENIYENSSAVIIIWNKKGEILRINRKFTEVFGYEEKEIIGKNLFDYLIYEKNKEKVTKSLSNINSGYRVTNFENKVLSKQGDILNMMWNDSAVRRPREQDYVIASFGIDITNQIASEQKIIKMAYFDELTDLPNRSMLQMEMENYISLGIPFSLYFVDVDNFKKLNDVHGHEYGDMFLKEYAKILLKKLEGKKIYRWCGDEFLVLDEVADDSENLKTIEWIMNFSSIPWHLEDVEFSTTVTIGVTKFPDDGKVFSTLMKNVDIALYMAKENGRGRYQYYNSRLQNEIEFIDNVERELNKAISNDLLELNFQPIFNLRDNAARDIEVLLRWPNNGFEGLNTVKFIRIAEKTGQILKIDKWVIEKTFMVAGGEFRKFNLNISINLSAQSFNSSELIDFLEDMILKYGVNPKYIQFEITEHSVINDVNHAIKIMNKLKGMGFRIVLDDFGTKYSSLNYLAKLPIDRLKIDKSYIDNIEAGENIYRIIVEQILELSRKIGLATVAEGIENEEQNRILLDFGCVYGQGYYLARPMDKESLIKLFT